MSISSGFTSLHLAHDADDGTIFGARSERAGGAVGASLLGHAIFFLICYVLVTLPAAAPSPAVDQTAKPLSGLVRLAVEGPGGGGGGGGNRSPEPPPKLQTRGPDSLSVPVLEPSPLTPPKTKPQGDVELSAIVREDGRVTDLRITRSLDGTFGLDEQAIKAARQWRCKPATRFGTPVAVYVTIAVGFAMR